LFGLGVQDKFVPKRYFSIDRVFRNEAVDRTHLAEFHQIEGMLAFLLLWFFAFILLQPIRKKENYAELLQSKHESFPHVTLRVLPSFWRWSFMCLCGTG
jgi:hypothetical protein